MSEAKLQIVEGGYYRARNGAKVGPMERNYLVFRDTHPWKAAGYPDTYRDDGKYDFCHKPSHEQDLIAPWTEPASEAPAEANKPDPGEGWRLLEDGERVQKGDEFCNSTVKTWTPSGNWKGPAMQEPTYHYRRRIPAPASVPSVDLENCDPETLRRANEIVTMIKDLQAGQEQLREANRVVREERDDLKRANAELVNRGAELGMQLNAIEAERDELRQQLEIAQQTGNELAAKLEELRADRDRMQGLLDNERNAYSLLKAAKPAPQEDADEDEPVTEEWLADHVHVNHKGKRYWCCSMFQISPFTQSNVIYIPFDATRRAVRQLLAALQISTTKGTEP